VTAPPTTTTLYAIAPGGMTAAVTIDACHDYLRKWTWRTTLQGHVYRNTSYREHGRIRCRRLYVHRIIMGLAPGDPRVVDHLNNNPLDNRRENLEVVTKAENVRRGSLPHARGTPGAGGVTLAHAWGQERDWTQWEAFERRMADLPGYLKNAIIWRREVLAEGTSSMVREPGGRDQLQRGLGILERIASERGVAI
jgi:hypothetical protein